MFRSRFLPGLVSPWMRIRLALRNISVPVLLSLLSLTVATSGFYFSNLRRVSAMSLSLLELRDSYDAARDVYAIDASLALANYGTRTVLVGAVQLLSVVDAPPLFAAGYDTKKPDEPTLTISNVPQVLKPGDVSVVSVRLEFLPPTREWMIRVKTMWEPKTPERLPVKLWLNFSLVTSGGALEKFTHELMTLDALALWRSPEHPTPPSRYVGDPSFAIIEKCVYVANVFKSLGCQTPY